MSNLSDDYDESDVSNSDGEQTNRDIDLGGIILKNNYILISRIGYGAFATVWLAYGIYKKKFYAIKVQGVDDYDAGLDEIDILLKVSKAHCEYFNKMIEHFTFDTDDGTHVCMIFELLAGSIYDLIKKGRYSDGLDSKIVKKIIRQVLIAMDCLNQKLNILHTDIKPENILLVGTSVRVQNIIDQFNKFNYNKLFKKHRKKLTKKIRNKNKVNKFASANAIKEIMNQMEMGNELENNNRYKSSSDEYMTESESDEEDKNYFPIKEKYFVDNIKIRLSDFGSCYEISDSMNNKIQTRYYMAPEIILNHQFNETCDIWSVGCMVYELLTGEILFDPDKKKRFNRDRHHLHDIQTTLGLIPQNIINNSKKRNHFFRKNGLIKGTNRIDYKPLSLILINKLGKRVDSEELALILDFLYMTLEIDPNRRPKAKYLINHNWLKD